ncbi:CatB-related O-acetyltransferase [Candidatus Roizmanbacteria bacterium]|nr:CatB-related O-acetyltransferase [Candidatus Roizmanbacteria bacterium]
MGGVFFDSKSSIDDYSYISGDNFGFSKSKILNTHIGKYCSIGTNLITLPSGHNYRMISNYPFKLIYPKNKDNLTSKPITINNDVWIGSNVIILGGVVISDGAVIGAGSVVTKNVPPYTIVAGNPAKIIKTRFQKNIVEQIKKEQWWNHKISQKLANRLNNI